MFFFSVFQAPKMRNMAIQAVENRNQNRVFCRRKKRKHYFPIDFSSQYLQRKKENEEEEKHFSDWVFISVPAIPERDRSDAGKVALLFLSLAAKYRNNFYYYLKV